ncbi:MAG: nucleoside hydrolase [Chthoniobacter sp.]|nr:nucleoside hydrolase [Chthoniobacter sp.]
MARKLILDVDTGTDDAVAILLAALAPGLELVGISTVNGNVTVEHATDNTLRVLALAGREDVGVHPGLSRPIVRADFPTPRDQRRGPAMHMTTLPFPPARRGAAEPGGVRFLLEATRAAAEPVTLVATAPLSNLAAALALDPALPSRVDALVVMGGGHAVCNVTPSAEFNVWADPEAAAVVFAAGFRRVVLVPLDATHQALVSETDCARLAGLGSAAGRAAAELIGRRIAAHATLRDLAERAAPVHDALCVAWLLRPELLSLRPAHVAVETTGRLTLGRTVMDFSGTREPANCEVALAADRAGFADLLAEVLRLGPA